MATPTELMAALIAEASTLVATFKSMATTITTTLNSALAATDAAVKTKLDAAILTLTSSTNLNGTYWVDAVSGSDTNTGLTSNLPFKTIGKAVSMTTRFKETVINLRIGQVHRVQPNLTLYGSVTFAYWATGGTAGAGVPRKDPAISGFLANLVPTDWEAYRAGVATIRFCLQNAAGELVDTYPESIGTRTPAQWYASSTKTPGFYLAGQRSDVRVIFSSVHIELPELSQIPAGYYYGITVNRGGVIRFGDHYAYVLASYIYCTIRTGGTRLSTGAGGTAKTHLQTYNSYVYLPNALLPENKDLLKAEALINNNGLTWHEKLPSWSIIWEDGTYLTSHEAVAITFQTYIWPTTGVTGVDGFLPPTNIMISGSSTYGNLTKTQYDLGITSLKTRLLVKDASYYLDATPV